MIISDLLQSYANLLVNVPIPSDRVIGCSHSSLRGDMLTIHIRDDNDHTMAHALCEGEWDWNDGQGPIPWATQQAVKATIKGTGGKARLLWFTTRTSL